MNNGSILGYDNDLVIMATKRRLYVIEIYIGIFMDKMIKCLELASK